MAKKQPSGYQNRKRREARAEARGQLMPHLRMPTTDDVSSLTGLTGTRLRFLCNWLRKELSTDDFAVFLKTLAEFRADAVARIQERQIENDERLARSLEALEGAQAGMPMVELPAQGAPPVGELIPRGTPDGEVSE